MIQPLSVSEPGVYNASDYGCDGFDPVNVSDKYKKLYEYATGGGSDNTTDDGQECTKLVGFGRYRKYKRIPRPVIGRV